MEKGLMKIDGRVSYILEIFYARAIDRTSGCYNKKNINRKTMYNLFFECIRTFLKNRLPNFSR